MDDLRKELAAIAGSLRAYLEVQADSGALGIPKGRRASPIATTATAATPSAQENATPTAPAIAAAPIQPVVAVDPLVRLPLLREEVASCTRCDLSKTRTNTVFSRGNPQARLMFLGEAPGQDEDEQGLPFVGRAGQLLDQIVKNAMGLDPETDVYVCNILKCRPPGNRRPTPEEMKTCSGYVEEQIQLVNPEVIVALGNTAIAGLLGASGISKLRGQWKTYRGIPVMPTYHPSYLLRPSPQQIEAKRQVWDDMKLVLKRLDLPIPEPKKK